MLNKSSPIHHGVGESVGNPCWRRSSRANPKEQISCVMHVPCFSNEGYSPIVIELRTHNKKWKAWAPVFKSMELQFFKFSSLSRKKSDLHYFSFKQAYYWLFWYSRKGKLKTCIFGHEKSLLFPTYLGCMMRNRVKIENE